MRLASPRACRPQQRHFLVLLGDLLANRGAGPGESQWPVFINEAAYGEKGIAFSLTERQRLACDPAWAQALADLLA